MANSYVAGKWSGTLSANLKGDASKTTPTLGDDFDSELNNLKKARTNVKNTINVINKEIKLLKNHAETGKMATMYLTFDETISSVTVHANNDSYPKTYKIANKRFTLTNLPSSGNIWIDPDSDIEYESGYGTPVYIITTNPSNSWYLDNDNTIGISEGRSCELSASVKANYNNIYLRTGEGIREYDVTYTNSLGESETTTVNSFTSSTRC